ncbi:MAG TPA: VOC family protein [Jatrophihabitans sp.]|nr:VOC family protein [Jatrophihabitans sp.]
MPAILDHVTVVTEDFAASRAVYEPVLAALGLLPTVEYSDPEADPDDPGEVAAVGYGTPDGRPELWLVAGLTPTTGAHLALAAPDRAVVRAAYESATAAGVRVVQPPRAWEDAQLHYYGTQFADPAGNLVEVLFRQSD